MLTLTVENVILNRLVEPRSHGINFICLLVKQFIYSSRCLGNELIFAKLKAHVNKVQNIEKYIALKHNRIEKHLLKWSCSNEAENRNECQLNDFVRQYLNEASQG